MFKKSFICFICLLSAFGSFSANYASYSTTEHTVSDINIPSGIEPTYTPTIEPTYTPTVTPFYTPTNTPDADDFSNIEEKSSVIPMNRTIRGMLNYSSDVDIFKFVPSTSGTYYFKLNSDLKYIIEIYDNEGRKNTYDGWNKKIITMDFTAIKPCFIKITGKEVSSIGAYNLAVSDDIEYIKGNDIKGYIKPGFADNLSSPIKAGVIVTIKGTGLFAMTNENGYFEILNVPQAMSGYNIILSKDGCLQREIKDILVIDSIYISKATSPIDIWPGDITNDGVVNMMDVLEIAKAFNSVIGEPVYKENADINKDSAINIMDVMIIAKYFNLSSEDYPKITI